MATLGINEASRCCLSSLILLLFESISVKRMQYRQGLNLFKRDMLAIERCSLTQWNARQIQLDLWQRFRSNMMSRGSVDPFTKFNFHFIFIFAYSVTLSWKRFPYFCEINYFSGICGIVSSLSFYLSFSLSLYLSFFLISTTSAALGLQSNIRWN